MIAAKCTRPCLELVVRGLGTSPVQGPEDLTLKKPDTQWCGLVTTKRSFSPSKFSGLTATLCEMERFRTSEVVSGQNIGTSVWCH